MTVLVTGGAGYIGSQVARLLLNAGYKVVVLDNLSTGSKSLVPKEATFVRGDIDDKTLVTALIHWHQVQEILHFAAFVDVEESMSDGKKYFHNNTNGTRALLFAAARAGVKRVIFSSTAAVYGNPNQMPVPEEAPAKPVNPYGFSKLLAEELVRLSGMDYAILRYFNVAGGGYALGDPTHLIRRAVRVALGDIDHLDIFGTDYPTPDGTAIRDYIHVADLAQAHLDVLNYLYAGGKSDTFNVGYGEGHSVLEVVDAVRRISGKSLQVVTQGRRPGDPAMIIADSSKLQASTKWTPVRKSLLGMIDDELAWVKSQKEL